MGEIKTEAKLIATEGMTVDYVKQNGSNAQKVAVQIFDADDSGDLKGNEVELFNNCVFKYLPVKRIDDVSADQSLVIYDKELQKNGYGGMITVDKLSYADGLKYSKDKLGYRHIGKKDDDICDDFRRHIGDCYHKRYVGFDKVDCTGHSIDEIKGAEQAWFEKVGNKVEKTIKTFFESIRNKENDDAQILPSGTVVRP